MGRPQAAGYAPTGLRPLRGLQPPATDRCRHVPGPVGAPPRAAGRLTRMQHDGATLAPS